MKEKPILFSAPMVRAILDGHKTQTRRLVKPQPNEDTWGNAIPALRWYTPSVERKGETVPANRDVYGFANEDYGWPCRYGAPGDRLWVKETWGWHRDFDPHKTQLGKGLIGWKADESGCPPSLIKHWVSSLYMPRWASRITLETTQVRVERLQDISQEDAASEGVRCVNTGDFVTPYATLWESINGPGSWDLNPWVWVITFKRISLSAN